MASNNPTGLLHSKQSPSGGHIPGDCAHISSHAVYTAVIVRTEAPVLLFNGQTTPNSAKPSPPLRSPLKLSPDKKFLWPNGISRRTRLSHGVLPALRLRPQRQRQRPRPRPSEPWLWGHQKFNYRGRCGFTGFRGSAAAAGCGLVPPVA
jgi:hypothetical protein